MYKRKGGITSGRVRKGGTDIKEGSRQSDGGQEGLPTQHDLVERVQKRVEDPGRNKQNSHKKKKNKTET